MKPIQSAIRLAVLLCALIGLSGHLPADDQATASGGAAENLTFHTEWKGERIELPPPFAPAMKLKGIEVIRFAPGMFDPKSDSFFSYALVFSVSQEQVLTEEIMQGEILTYYRGLAGAVLKSKGKEVDADKFTLKLHQSKEATGTPEKVPGAVKFTEYTGQLDWVEPFVTAKSQVLHFEIQSWTDPRTARNYLFVCTSPKAIAEADGTWKELRRIRRSFEVTGGAASK